MVDTQAPYHGTVKKVALTSKKGVLLGTTWYVTLTAEDWQGKVRQIGGSATKGSDPQATRDNLKHSLIAAAQANSLSTDGLDAYLTELLQGVGV